MRKAILTAQRTADAMVAEAEKKAAQLMNNAQTAAESGKHRRADSPQQNINQDRERSALAAQHTQRTEHAEGLHCEWDMAHGHGNPCAYRNQHSKKRGINHIDCFHSCPGNRLRLHLSALPLFFLHAV